MLMITCSVQNRLEDHMSTNSNSLQGSTVVVVGGGSGIGAAVARASIEQGAQVVLVGSRIERLRATAAALGSAAQARAADVTDQNSLAALFAGVGRVDHLVVTAGPALGSPPFAETDVATAQAGFDVKFWGSVRAVQAALPVLGPQASITLTSGLLSRKAVPGGFVKATMNAALESLARTLAKELAPRRVNVVSPGVTDTEAYAHLSAEQRAAMFDRTGKGLPVGRVGKPEEVAEAYLLAMRNGFMTGAVIDVEGGGLL